MKKTPIIILAVIGFTTLIYLMIIHPSTQRSIVKQFENHSVNFEIITKYLTNNDYVFISISNDTRNMYVSYDNKQLEIEKIEDQQVLRSLEVLFDELHYTNIKKDSNNVVSFWDTYIWDFSIRGIAYTCVNGVYPKEIDVEQYIPVRTHTDYYYFKGR